MDKTNQIPCVVMRGGTSKGLYFLKRDLPEDERQRDALLLRIMGSPDPKQIDGLGGAASVTSKVAIVSRSERPGIDVDYTFAQVSVDKPLVSYRGNCGNISSGVGPFALEMGLVNPRKPLTTVRIYNTNTEKVIEEQVQIEDGHVKYRGSYAIAGVPGTAAPIKMSFLEPMGSVTGKLLPTGNASDVLDVPGFGPVEVSIVDAANPLVFAAACDLGLSGAELPGQIDGNEEILGRLEAVRGAAALKLGFVQSAARSAWDSPTIPKMTIVSAPGSYVTTAGAKVEGEQIDLLARMMSMQKTHPTYAMTGAMCTAAAAVIPGTVVSRVLGPDAKPERLRIGHPGGVLEAGVEFDVADNAVHIVKTSGYRTANLLMKGVVCC
ncbi:MAG: 3-methylitaconate isomerase [Enterocloster asparagiformis]|nr:3-methylitaconate isomerase [Enterocloster asparagiformis]